MTDTQINTPTLPTAKNITDSDLAYSSNQKSLNDLTEQINEIVKAGGGSPSSGGGGQSNNKILSFTDPNQSDITYQGLSWTILDKKQHVTYDGTDYYARYAVAAYGSPLLMNKDEAVSSFSLKSYGDISSSLIGVAPVAYFGLTTTPTSGKILVAYKYNGSIYLCILMDSGASFNSNPDSQGYPVFLPIHILVAEIGCLKSFIDNSPSWFPSLGTSYE